MKEIYSCVIEKVFKVKYVISFFKNIINLIFFSKLNNDHIIVYILFTKQDLIYLNSIRK